MKKLKAFTLMELMIGMIIGSIVVGFCYMGYSIIWKQFIDFKKTKQEINNTIQFNEILMNDFSRSEKILFSDNQLAFHSDSSVIIYNFTETFILRSNNDNTDTFKFVTSELQPQYLEEIKSVSTGIIKSFSFNAKILDNEEKFSFYKAYSASFLMNHIQD